MQIYIAPMQAMHARFAQKHDCVILDNQKNVDTKSRFDDNNDYVNLTLSVQ